MMRVDTPTSEETSNDAEALGGCARADVVETLAPTELAELLGAFNNVAGKLQVTHDVLTAEVARLREQLREADEQIERSRRLAALGEMAAGIAHEIRNPLGSIGLYASMLGEDLADRPAERGLAQKICRAVRGLNAIVTDVLAFSGSSSLRWSECDAIELAEVALEHAGACALSAGVRVRVEHEDEERAEQAGLTLACDAGKVRQALINVIRNGIDSIEEARKQGLPGNDELVVGVQRRAVGERMMMVFSVRDSGTGLDTAATERMFNPFYTTREVGTGLGLAIVHRIVDAHNGQVHIRNNGPDVGKGATVEILFPIERTDVADRVEQDMQYGLQQD